MKVTIKKIILTVLALASAVSILSMNSRVYADPSKSSGFADFSDEQADEITNKEQAEQEKEIADNANKSTNNYLSELSVNGYELLPKFDRQIIEYSISNDLSATEIEINAKTEDEKATVEGTGKVTLNSGENNIQVNVKAESGTVRTYTIKVNKKTSEKTCKLSQLNIKFKDGKNNEFNIQYSPEFNVDTYIYNCEVENEVTKLNIDAKSNDNVDIVINGADDLKVGENIITIAVTSKDDSTNQSIYKIKVNKKEYVEQEKENKTSKFIAIGAAISAAIIGGLVATKKHKRENRRRKH